MEELQRSKTILKLGKLLVSEFDLAKSTDTLGRWMVHYISELIINAQAAKDELKVETETRCFNEILKFWQHINVFPKGSRPLVDIEPFIRTLEAISPENENSFYHSQYFEDFNDKSSFSLSNSWLNLAKEIDYSARILIEMCLRSSANEIIEGEVDYFALADLLNVDIPTMKVIRFTLQNSEISEADKKMSETKERIERLQTRKSHLERFIYLSDTMKQEIEKELINLGVK